MGIGFRVRHADFVVLRFDRSFQKGTLHGRPVVRGGGNCTPLPDAGKQKFPGWHVALGGKV